MLLPNRVHIADVSYFLVENTPLDLEAQNRATSIYLVQKVIPMLPSLLCEQLCSLNPNVDRLAFSCIFKIYGDGTLYEEPPYFGRTVIRSCAKLDYPTAQRMIEGIIPSIPSVGANPDYFFKDISEDVWEERRRPIGQTAWECSRDVCLMNSIASSRRKIRLNYGALVLNKPKLTFQLDENGNPGHVTTYTIRDSNKLVEEYMLLANYLVAQEMLTYCGKSAFLRNHPPPMKENFEDLKLLASKFGLHIDITSAQSLQQSLKEISSHRDPFVSKAITALLLHPMNLANYFVVGESTRQSVGTIMRCRYRITRISHRP